MWWNSWSPAVAPYALLFRLFLDARISADELEVIFLRLYKSDATAWSPEIFDVLDRFFADVDSYIEDEQLRVEVHGLDEATLRGRAQQAFEDLRRLAVRDP